MPSRASKRQRHGPDMSLVLAFDCAVSGLAVAVLNDGEAVAVHREPGREQAARLLPAIGGALAAAGVDRHALSMISVTVGPGSFTGVRVGLAAARGLAVALAVPLAGIATTAVLLAQAQAAERRVIAAIDSHLGDWFCVLGADGGDAADSPFTAGAAELVPRLRGRRCLVVGSQATQLAARLADLGIDVEGQEALPDPVVLARLAAAEGVEAWRARNRREGLPRPLYLRGVNITLPSGERRTVE
jgi:tRNA threonylcarbamoyladenosine biosynthesis protein TsaB